MRALTAPELIDGACRSSMDELAEITLTANESVGFLRSPAQSRAA
jgi:hypothetical protein